MKKIVSLLILIALFTLNGCSSNPEKVGASKKNAAKSKEVLDRIVAHKAQWGKGADKNAQFKPKVLVTLTGDMSQPDGMTVNPKTKTIFLNCPNFNSRVSDGGPKKYPGTLVRVNLTGDTAVAEKLFVYEEVIPFPETGQVGPMGLYFGPDGHLYVCDNQYFFNPNHKSRILRVLMDGDVPTGKIEVVVEGIKLANAILWVGNRMFVSDTFLDREGEFGAGCVWKFAGEEIFKAGTDGNPPITLQPASADNPYIVSIQSVKELPGCGNGGADGVTVDKDGILYFGNFGNGELYRILFDENGKATTDVIHDAGDYFSCCDGIFYDADTNKVYVNDSATNAIHAFVPPLLGKKAVFETLWDNGDTDGADGSLDQPCELVIVDGKMVIANFDWPFPQLLNSETSEPNTLSVINLQ